jgi:hypothetical protein
MGLKAEMFWYNWMATYGIKETAMQYHFKLKNYNTFRFCYKYEVFLIMYFILSTILTLYISQNNVQPVLNFSIIDLACTLPHILFKTLVYFFFHTEH